MTGAPLPAGADTLLSCLSILSSKSRNTFVSLSRARFAAGEHVVARASEAHTGDIVLPVGRRIAAAEIAVAAACGCAQLDIFAKPKVAIIATGDELARKLAELGPEPEPWQIFNSNSYSLAALAQQTGAEPHRLPIARDNLSDLRARLTAASDADLLLFSGGVSAGKFRSR